MAHHSPERPRPERDLYANCHFRELLSDKMASEDELDVAQELAIREWGEIAHQYLDRDGLSLDDPRREMVADLTRNTRQYLGVLRQRFRR